MEIPVDNTYGGAGGVGGGSLILFSFFSLTALGGAVLLLGDLKTK